MEENTLQHPFASEPVGRLLIRFAVPSIISMVVNSVYNMVDQIFIGQGVGYIGNTATNICFPFTTMYLALSLLIGDGAAALFSLRLGEGRREEARDTVGTAILLGLLVGGSYTALCELALQPLLGLFGCTESAFPYAVEYASITLLGVPFVAVSIACSNIIRADGSPQYSMFCMLAGCFTNIALDWHFVMNLGWGIAGAAWATVIGQVLNCALAVIRLPKLKNVQLSLRTLRLRRCAVFQIGRLGISSFITQGAATFVVILMNRSLSTYGALSIYGSDIPQAAFGNVMKVNQVVVAVLLGLGVGSQPIVGFNYGARIYERVRQTYLICIGAATTAAVTGWGFCQLFTQDIVNLFGQEGELYNQFALNCFHIFLSMVLLYGVTVPTGIFFQAIGKPVKALLCSLGRQVLFFVPCIFIMRAMAGLEGLLYAGPIADVCAFLLSGALGLREMRLMRQQSHTPQTGE